MEKLRVAITSSDGVWVDEHFGHAKKFHIFEVDGSGCRLVEVRTNTLACTNCAMHDCFDETYSLLRDCQIVISCKIGEAAKVLLAERNIQGYAMNIATETALKQVELYFLRRQKRNEAIEDLPDNHPIRVSAD
jgi:predicted Fe-Mo cluster-binding NifX family protein